MSYKSIWKAHEKEIPNLLESTALGTQYAPNSGMTQLNVPQSHLWTVKNLSYNNIDIEIQMKCSQLFYR